jgi:A/G-specific adenine glycosylase
MKSSQNTSELRDFRRRLLRWYDANKRDLPWRGQHDPYRVWLSEVMLQQTRVNAVVEHYHRFLQQFPTVQKLAASRESSVLAAWSGLGYYRRARMLHAAAKKVVDELHGEIPTTAEGLRELAGIGRYTAAAIASIAFGQPSAVVDGNVERVLSRVSGKAPTGEVLWDAAGEFLDPARPGDFNQAMMELGATICLPRGAMCETCPVERFCTTKGDGIKVDGPARQRKREISYRLACRNGSVFLVQRPSSVSLMPGMWELPEVQSSNGTNGTCLTLRHSITVTNYTVRVQRGAAPKCVGKWVTRTKLGQMPLTGLARKILRATEIMGE